MNQPIRFSLIITSYNQQDYISSCIQSIKKQTYPYFECLIVDDGSSDHTVSNILNEIADDSRFKLFTQHNQGVSSARNAALSNIQGAYVTFIDGDDELAFDCLEKCSHYIKDYDLLIFGIVNVYYEKNRISERVETSPYVTSFKNGKELASWYVRHHAILLYSCGNKMYRTSIIRAHGLCFDPEINWGEDRLFNYQYLAYCKGIRSVSDCFYLYKHIDKQSLTSEFRPHHMDTLLRLHNLKMKHLLPLAVGASSKETAAFRQYDIQKEVYNAFLHIAEHARELPPEILAEEYNYLNTRSLPPYFYGSNNHPIRRHSASGLTDWITHTVYGNDNEPDATSPDAVIILGSRSCSYRVKAALEHFRHRPDLTFICSGGNLSKYLDQNGNEFVEADYMYNYLLGNGIDEDSIITEKDSHNTYENIVNSIKLYHELSPQKQPGKYTIVTAGFHKSRVKQLIHALNHNITIHSVDGPNTQRENWYKNKIGLDAVFAELRKLMA